MSGYVEFKKEKIMPLPKKKKKKRKGFPEKTIIWDILQLQCSLTENFLLEISPRGKKAKYIEL